MAIQTLPVIFEVEQFVICSGLIASVLSNFSGSALYFCKNLSYGFELMFYTKTAGKAKLL